MYCEKEKERINFEVSVLKEYKGAILIVSHTEEFIKELKPTRALILPENYFNVWSEDILERVSET